MSIRHSESPRVMTFSSPSLWSLQGCLPEWPPSPAALPESDPPLATASRFALGLFFGSAPRSPAQTDRDCASIAPFSCSERAPLSPEINPKPLLRSSWPARARTARQLYPHLAGG